MKNMIKKISKDIHSKCRMFCFPYAGANYNMFNEWSMILGDAVDIYSIEMPGKGSRFLEKPYEKISLVVEEFIREWSKFDNKPFVLLGHSLGALIAFECAKIIQSNKENNLKILFISACNYPDLKNVTGISTLKKENFLSKIVEMGGVSKDLCNEEILDIFYPILKSDFKMNEDYRNILRQKLTCDIVVYNGSDDKYIDNVSLYKWANYTTGNCFIHTINGDHFFINSNKEVLLRDLLNRLYRNGLIKC